MSAATASTGFSLRPQERRIVAAIAVVVFLVLNALLVLPHRHDCAQLMKAIADTRKQIGEQQAEIDRDTNFATTNCYKRELKNLVKEGAGNLSVSDANQLVNTITEQARMAGVMVSSYDPVSVRHAGPTNALQFYEEKSERIAVVANEADLVKFLYNIGNDAAMIRVSELEVHPMDNNRFKLTGKLTLTASYQKSPLKPAASAAASTAKPGAAAGPGAAPAAAATPAKPATPVPPPGVKPSTNAGARVGATNGLRGTNAPTRPTTTVAPPIPARPARTNDPSRPPALPIRS